MTVTATELADALRWIWLGAGLVWIAYAWLHRIAYPRVLWSLLGLVALDWFCHRLADFVERPASNLPSDFSVYSLMMLTAGIAGFSVAFLYARWRGISFTSIAAAACLCIIAGAFAARAQYVWMNWDYFAENTELITDLSVGGTSWRGAFLTGLVALFLFTLVTRQSFWQFADAAALGAALASSIGWYGAHITHLYYGLALEAAQNSAGIFEPLRANVRAFAFQFVQDLPDAYNVIALRIPVQLMASIFFLVLFFVLVYIALREKSRAHDGSAFLWFLVCASAAGFIFGFWRGDATVFWNGLRADQWIDLMVLILALGLMGARKLAARSRAHKPHPITIEAQIA